MFAIIRTGGRQFKVNEDMRLRVPSLGAAVGEIVTFDQVLLLSRDGETVVGHPCVPGAVVEGEVIRHGLEDKVVIFKMKRRKNYRRTQGHRDKFTEVLIRSIRVGAAAAPKPAEPAPTV